MPHPYETRQIINELQHTAMGDGFYGNALRVAKDLPCLSADDRHMLDKWAAGKQERMDHVRLQEIALKIHAATDAQVSFDSGTDNLIADRAAFEDHFRKPPYEFELDIMGEDSAWPGNYRRFAEQCAWEGFQVGLALLRHKTPPADRCLDILGD